MSTQEKKRRQSSNARANTSATWGVTKSQAYTTYSRIGGVGSGIATNFTRTTLTKQRPVTGSAQKDASGFRPPTGFRSYVCLQVDDKPFRYKAKSSTTGPTNEYFGDASGLPLSTSLYDGTSGAGRFPRVSENLRNRAITETLNKLKDSEFSLGEDIAELHGTLQMIVDALYRAARVINALRQKKWREAADHLVGAGSTGVIARLRQRRPSDPFRINRLRKKVADSLKRHHDSKYGDSLSSNWLEYQYGWKPLFGTISAALAIARQKAELARIPYRTVKHTVVDSDDLPAQPSGYGLWTVDGAIKNIVFHRIDVKVTDANLASLDSLGLANPFSLAWNLLSYSFVIDWLLPIGNVLAGLSAPWGISFFAGSRTETTIAKINYEYVPQLVYFGGQPRSCGLNSLATVRTTLSSIPMPRLYVKSPFTFSRLATALALLHQARRK